MSLHRERKSRETKFCLIAKKAKEKPNAVFTSLAHHLTEEYLEVSFRKLRKKAAYGEDKVSYADYESNLANNIKDLHQRLRTQQYRAPNIRRVWIDKGEGKKRPLGISTIEDKIVQREKVMETLPKRMNKYGLTIHPEKSKLFEFVPANEGKDRTLEFLGFTHYWTKSQRGNAIIKRKTSKKGLRKSIKKLTECCRHNRHERLKKQYRLLCSKLRGLYQYYGIRGNSKFLSTIYDKALLLWYKWLNRRSQHNSYIMEGYKTLLQHFPLPNPKIVHWNV